MDKELMLDVSQAHELKLAFRRAGYTNADIKKLCEGDLLARLLPVVCGYAEVTHVTHVIDCDADPFIPHEGWKVEEHRKGGQITWNPEAITLYTSLEQTGDNHIRGNKVWRELFDKPVLNANVLDYLTAYPHLIPDEWKKYEDIYFWGTTYRDLYNDLWVRYLYFDGKHWKCQDIAFSRAWLIRRHPAALLVS